MTKNIPSNKSKKVKNLSADETTFIKSEHQYNKSLVESEFKHNITFQQQKDTSTVTNNTKNLLFSLTYCLNVSKNIGKKSLA